MKLYDRVLKKLRLVHLDKLPMTDFTVSYHYPATWGEQPDPPYSIEAMLRNGTRVRGDLYPVVMQ